MCRSRGFSWDEMDKYSNSNSFVVLCTQIEWDTAFNLRCFNGNCYGVPSSATDISPSWWHYCNSVTEWMEPPNEGLHLLRSHYVQTDCLCSCKHPTNVYVLLVSYAGVSGEWGLCQAFRCLHAGPPGNLYCFVVWNKFPHSKFYISFDGAATPTLILKRPDSQTRTKKSCNGERHGSGVLYPVQR